MFATRNQAQDHAWLPPHQSKQVLISEEMAEELTPAKAGTSESNSGVGLGNNSRLSSGESKGGAVEEDREGVLSELAKACKRQGNFHLACKKYTQVRIVYQSQWAG